LPKDARSHRFMGEPAVLKRLALALTCVLLFVAQTLAQQARSYQILPFADKITECRASTTLNTACVISEVLVLKPNNEIAACSATIDLDGRKFQFSATLPAPSCLPLQCSKCDLIPPISPTENRLELYRTYAAIKPLTIDAGLYWGINQQTGGLTVCAIDPPVAECKSATP
jgi:hypothetical protein